MTTKPPRDDKPPKKSAMAAEIRDLWLFVRHLERRVISGGVPSVVSQFADAVRTHEERLHKLENRIDVVAATVHHAHESRLDDLERRTTNIDARHRLSDSKKRAPKKAPKGRRT